MIVASLKEMRAPRRLTHLPGSWNNDFFEEVSSMNNWKSNRLMLTSARSIATWWIKCTAKRLQLMICYMIVQSDEMSEATIHGQKCDAEHFTSESWVLIASTLPGSLCTIFWDQSAGICSHPATITLVGSTTDVDQQGLALIWQLII